MFRKHVLKKDVFDRFCWMNNTDIDWTNHSHLPRMVVGDDPGGRFLNGTWTFRHPGRLTRTFSCAGGVPKLEE